MRSLLSPDLLNSVRLQGGAEHTQLDLIFESPFYLHVVGSSSIFVTGYQTSAEVFHEPGDSEDDEDIEEGDLDEESDEEDVSEDEEEEVKVKKTQEDKKPAAKAKETPAAQKAPAPKKGAGLYLHHMRNRVTLVKVFSNRSSNCTYALNSGPPAKPAAKPVENSDEDDDAVSFHYFVISCFTCIKGSGACNDFNLHSSFWMVIDRRGDTFTPIEYEHASPPNVMTACVTVHYSVYAFAKVMICVIAG
jgi:hypothetical protein